MSADVNEFLFKEPPREGWKNFGNNGMAFNVAGISYRKPAALDFIRIAANAHKSGRPVGIELELESTNEYNNRAIKVIGFADVEKGFIWKKTVRMREHIGYIPDDLLPELSGQTVQARLWSAYVSDNNFVDIKIITITPSLPG